MFYDYDHLFDKTNPKQTLALEFPFGQISVSSYGLNSLDDLSYLYYIPSMNRLQLKI